MEKLPRLHLCPKCRLCGASGYHHRDIFDDASSDLAGKIYRCVGVWVSWYSSLQQWRDSLLYRTHLQVKRNDKMPKTICHRCFNRINEIVRYRKICAATNVQLRLSQFNYIADAAVEVTSELNAMQKIDIQSVNALKGDDSPVEYILIDDETESEYDETLAIDEFDGKCSSSVHFEYPGRNCEVQLEESDDSYMSPLRYETDSDDGTYSEITVCEEPERNAKMETRDKSMTRIKCIPRKAKSNRVRMHTRCTMCRQHSRVQGRLQETKTFDCYLCKNSYKSKQWLQKHMKCRHIDRQQERFHCSFSMCSKSFSQRSTLTRHINDKHIFAK